MKNNLLALIIIGMFLLVLVSQSVSAEMNLWNSVSLNNQTSIMSAIGVYSFDDTSPLGVGKNKPVHLVIQLVTQALPLNLTTFLGNSSVGYVDYCNFTSSHYINSYNSAGEIINTSIEIFSYYFGTGSVNTTYIDYDMRSRDTLTLYSRCHYTNSSSLFFDNIYPSEFTTYLSTFECKGCGDSSLEELTGRVDSQAQTIQNELDVYRKIQKVIALNYTLWVIMKWLVFIGLLISGFVLLVAGIFYFYYFLKNLARKI